MNKRITIILVYMNKSTKSFQLNANNIRTKYYPNNPNKLITKQKKRQISRTFYNKTT